MPLKSQSAGRFVPRWVLAIATLLLVAAAYVALDWYVAAPVDALATATYVGRDACAQCHAPQVEAHRGSRHDRAMELATPESVEGDFDNAELSYHGITARFFRRGDDYFVHTEGPDGTMADFQVKYTFGVEPLQQYMVEFPDGRVQVLRESWDTEKNEWFYLPPPDATDLRLAPDDPTHWTGIGQNWNSTCAECHSTNLEKKYDLATDSYHTTYSEIDVSCEACHGPASLHVRLAESNSLFWDRRHGLGLHQLKSASNRSEIETCAQCHSRQVGQMVEGFRPGDSLYDFYQIALLDEGLYHADGQIEDEVFAYGSFLQSKMHAKGVRCSDCHDPHSTRLRFEGNALCAQCHVPAKFDTPAHHHHQMGTPGASCVECHMPATHYMVVDPRRDHSIRVPRPDLTVAIGTPNACNKCHTKPEESAEWAAAAVEKWYGPKRHDDPHWAPAFAAGRAGEEQGEALLLKVWRRHQTPAIVRATAIGLLSQYPSAAVAEAFRQALRDPEPMVRRAAVMSVPLAPQDIEHWLVPLLGDSSRGVRIAVAQRLLDVPSLRLNSEEQEQLDRAMTEYRQMLARYPEISTTHVALANMALLRGDMQGGMNELRMAIKLAPYRAGPRHELAMWLAANRGDAAEIARLRREEIALLERDIEFNPRDAQLRSLLGVLHTYLGQFDQAEERMREAVELAPLRGDLLTGLAEIQLVRYRQSPDEATYERGLETLRKLNPNDPTVAGLLEQWRAARRQATPRSP